MYVQVLKTNAAPDDAQSRMDYALEISCLCPNNASPARILDDIEDLLVNNGVEVLQEGPKIKQDISGSYTCGEQ